MKYALTTVITLKTINRMKTLIKQQGIYCLQNPSNGIQWTGKKRWNTITGCTPCSAGCQNCWAKNLSENYKRRGFRKFCNGFKLTLHPNELNTPKKWRKPQMVFIDTMSDTFHEEVPDEYNENKFGVMNQLPQHQFQVLTKRSKRLVSLTSKLTLTPNIWVGVSVENQKAKKRIDHLRQVPAHIRFLSIEPLIGPLNNLDLTDIKWVIVGGESPNPNARPCDLKWIENIVYQCVNAGVAVFVKQMGMELGKKLGMVNNKKGDDITKFPKHLRKWEFPIDITPYLHCF